MQRPDRPWLIRYSIATDHDTTTVAAAVRQLVACRPTLAARLHESEPTWVLDGAVTTAGPADLDTAFDLGCGALSISWAEPGSLEIVANHALVDGRGLLGVVEDLVAVLDGRAVGARTDVDDDHLALIGAAPRRQRITALTDAIGAVARRVQTIDAADRTTIARRTISRADIESARVEGCSRNDLFVAAVHLAMQRHLGGRRPTSVSVPVDLRPMISAPDGLGNAVLNASTRIAPHRSLSAATRAVSAQIARQREPDRLRAGLAQALGFLPAGRPRDSTSRRALWSETAVCSNVGDLTGPVADADLDFAPPAHQLVAFGIAGARDHHVLTVRSRLPAPVSNRLADDFVALLQAAG